MNARLQGLYAITPRTSGSPGALAEQVASAIAGGARIVQYRDKCTEKAVRYARASALLERCRQSRIPLIINDDPTLAAELGADGVHLGRDDPDPRQTRERLGENAIIGVSCYNDIALAEAAERAGATYVAFGSFFPSATKPEAVQAEPALLTEAKRRLRIPLVAIGGITPQNGGLLIAAGARMLAVVTGIFAEPDIAASSRAYSNLFLMENP